MKIEIEVGEGEEVGTQTLFAIGAAVFGLASVTQEYLRIEGNGETLTVDVLGVLGGSELPQTLALMILGFGLLVVAGSLIGILTPRIGNQLVSGGFGALTGIALMFQFTQEGVKFIPGPGIYLLIISVCLLSLSDLMNPEWTGSILKKSHATIGLMLFVLGAFVAFFAHGQVVSMQTLSGEVLRLVSEDKRSSYEMYKLVRLIGGTTAVAGFAITLVFEITSDR